jgi:hypothetical protein
VPKVDIAVTNSVVVCPKKATVGRRARVHQWVATENPMTQRTVISSRA